MMPDPSRVNGSDSAATAPPDITPAATIPPESHPSRQSLLRRLWPTVVFVLFLGGSIWLWWQQDRVLDWVRLRNYMPPSNVHQLAEQTTMTSYGQRLFYVNRPAIEDRIDFNDNCPNVSEETAVLGCYRGDRQGIHIYEVTDERLNGIQQVTAAHEMLHQAYDRLGGTEKKRINAELEAYARTVTDTTLLEKLDTYRKSEPHDVVNEMHSIFGTEVADLPASLEAYYRRYFTNRNQVLGYYAQYRLAFTQRQERIAAIDEQLAVVRKQLEADKTAIDVREKQLQRQRSQLDAWLAQGELDRYNAAVPGFNGDIEIYKALVGTTNVRINEYNGLVDERNTLAVQEKELIEAQDSSAPAAGTP